MFFGNRKSQFERRTTVTVPLGAFLLVGAALLGPFAGATQGLSASATVPHPARAKSEQHFGPIAGVRTLRARLQSRTEAGVRQAAALAFPIRSRGSSSATSRKSRRPFASPVSAAYRCSTRTETCCADRRAMIHA
jgi:hypothetical protein